MREATRRVGARGGRGGGAPRGGGRGADEAGEGAVIAEKNPKHVLRLPFLAALLPHARFLHIVRDGRDVCASLMFRNRGANWGHLEIPGWRDLLERYPQENWIRCAHQWHDAVAIARNDAVALGDRYMEVRYEDLVCDPAATVTASLRFCGLDACDEAAAFWPRIQDATAGSYHARKQVRHYVENHTKRVGRFRENLDDEQLAAVEAVCGDLLRELGYPVE